MRGLLLFVGIALAAALVVAAVLIVSTGKTYMFSFGAGHPNSVSRAAAYVFIALWVALALGVALHLLAHAYPKRYYPLLWWRDLAWLAAGGSLLFVVGVAIWRQIAYGVV